MITRCSILAFLMLVALTFLPQPAQGQNGALADMWRKSKSTSDRDKVIDIAKERLEQRFEIDMRRRERELKAVEMRIKRLRDQLDRRADSKGEIIELQLKNMTMAWDGLGWSDEDGGEHFFEHVVGDEDALAHEAMHSAEHLVELMHNASQEGDSEQLMMFARDFADEAAALDPFDANQVIWVAYETFQDEVQSKKFWLQLAAAADEASREAEGARLQANILDTVARLYHLGGKSEKAYKFQKKAVSYSREAGDGETDEVILEFYKELGDELGLEEDEEEENEFLSRDDEEEDESLFEGV